jgi:hypothetical protein
MTAPPSRPEARSRLGSQSANELGAPVTSSIPEQLPGLEPASARKGYEDALEVAAVYQNGEWLILDNLTNLLVRDSEKKITSRWLFWTTGVSAAILRRPGSTKGLPFCPARRLEPGRFLRSRAPGRSLYLAPLGGQSGKHLVGLFMRSSTVCPRSSCENSSARSATQRTSPASCGAGNRGKLYFWLRNTARRYGGTGLGLAITRKLAVT